MGKKSPTVDEIKKRVNKVGASFENPSERYIFVADTGKKTKCNCRIVKIQNKKTKKCVEYTLNNLEKGTNPFRCTQNRTEEKVIHPKMVRYFKSLGLEVVQEKSFESLEKGHKRDRPDILVRNDKGDICVIEVKHDESPHNKKDRNIAQTQRYRKSVKKAYGRKYRRTFLCSLKGTEGCMTPEEVKLVMKQMRFI